MRLLTASPPVCQQPLPSVPAPEDDSTVVSTTSIRAPRCLVDHHGSQLAAFGRAAAPRVTGQSLPTRDLEQRRG
ncbi:hypothetical protein C8T65DRAFT_649289 [Cerioporus squamosus]|nr:hypothetical protein C8T65DRAFT_649289 [Cerioporus squamosus]